jgi:hypothetical protein
MLHAYVQRFDVTVTMQKLLALFSTKHGLSPACMHKIPKHMTQCFIFNVKYVPLIFKDFRMALSDYLISSVVCQRSDIN